MPPFTTLAMSLLLLPAALAAGEAAWPPPDQTFPADAGLIDVTKPPYNAKGDGKTDDTAAINQAVHAYPWGKAIVYLPKGTYLVSDTITWPKGPQGWEWKGVKLRGEDREKSVLRLMDSAPGFADPAKPKGVIWTGPKPEQRFDNAIENLTVEVGTGNPGACGIQFNASNTGRLVGVIIRAAKGSGLHGLDMGYDNQIGPLLVKYLEVHGFEHGIFTQHAVESQTFEHVRIRNPRQAGWLNKGQVCSVRGLSYEGAGPALIQEGGNFTLLDGQLRCSGKGPAALLCAWESRIYLRSVATTDFAQALAVQPGKDPATQPGGTVAGPAVKEHIHSPKAVRLDAQGKPGSVASLHLPIEETPVTPWPAHGEWANVQAFGATVTGQEGWGDSGEAIQKAIDSGKPVVYFPNNAESAYPTPRGGYGASKQPVKVRGKVQRLVGCDADFKGSGHWSDPVTVEIGDGDVPVVLMERIGNATVKINTKRTVVLKHMSFHGLFIEGGGKVFIEDCCVAPIRIGKGCQVWARQLNPEMNNRVKEKWGPHVINDGGTLWVLGWKNEGGGTLIETKNGGATEILGGNIYTTFSFKGNADPMFSVADTARFSIVAAQCQFGGDKYGIYLRSTRGGTVSDLLRDQLPWNCGQGMALPLVVSIP